jgi:hypothetical protein
VSKFAAEQRVFDLEDLVVTPSQPSEESGRKDAPKAKRQRREPFIVTTATQAQKLEGVTRLITERVFRHLQFRWFRAYRKPFKLPSDALSYAGIDRFAQLRALTSLQRLGLISVERDGPRKPPLITIL